MAKGTFRRVGMTAVPAGDTAREALEAIRDGGLFIADFKGARNPRQHDLFWSLCDLVADHQDSNKYAVEDWLLKKQNLVDIFWHPDGSMHVRAKSLAYESMEQAVFDRFFRIAVEHIGQLLEAAPKDVWQRYVDLLDPETRADMSKRLKRMRSPSIAPEQVTETETEDAK